MTTSRRIESIVCKERRTKLQKPNDCLKLTLAKRVTRHLDHWVNSECLYSIQLQLIIILFIIYWRNRTPQEMLSLKNFIAFIRRKTIVYGNTKYEYNIILTGLFRGSLGILNVTLLQVYLEMSKIATIESYHRFGTMCTLRHP